jgi:glutathionylspermidine synthase
MIATVRQVAVDNYQEQRKQIYEPIRDLFSWDIWHGQEYALASYGTITRDFQTEILLATKLLGEIFAKVVKVVQAGSTELWKELGLPPASWPALRLAYDYPNVTVVGRFDFAYTTHGLKMMEFNSDTPTSIMEAFYVNQHVCDYYGQENPNQGMKNHIQAAFQQILQCYQSVGYDTKRLFFCSVNDDLEEKATTQYLLAQSGCKATFISLPQIAYDPTNECLVAKLPAGDYEQIDVLYRLHAMEVIAEDRNSKGFPIGAKLLELVAKKRLALINPPGAFIAQTKALQALIWNLYESNLFFSTEEREIVATYCLPTYLENQFHGKQAYVKKPIFGREGGAVSLYDAMGQLELKDNADFYWDQQMIYQQRVEMPIVTVETANGPFTGKLLWGSFLMGGQPSAIVARVDREITGNMSYYLPIALSS